MFSERSDIIPNHNRFVNTFFHLFIPFFSTPPCVSKIDLSLGAVYYCLFIVPEINSFDFVFVKQKQ